VVTCIGTARPEYCVDSNLLALALPGLVHLNFCPNHRGGFREFEEIFEEVMKHQHVLIHCKMGQKRSVIVAAAVAMAANYFEDWITLDRFLEDHNRQLAWDEKQTVRKLTEFCVNAAWPYSP